MNREHSIRRNDSKIRSLPETVPRLAQPRCERPVFGGVPLAPGLLGVTEGTSCIDRSELVVSFC
jgi:hypothetical protein